MTHLFDALARRQTALTYLAQIEGIGDVNGLHTWSVNVPDYAAADARFRRRDTFAELPKVTPGRTKSILGGMPEAGSATLRLVDFDDLITQALATDVPPNSELATTISAVDMSITLVDGGGLPGGPFVWWTGAEAILIQSRAANVLTVAAGGRAWLGTAARTHVAGDLGYTSPPFVRTRLLSLYLSPMDAANDGEALLYAVGTYRIDRVNLADKLGSWVLSGASEERALSRLVGGRIPVAMRLNSVSGSQQLVWAPMPGTALNSVVRVLALWPDGATFIHNDRTGEVIRANIGGTTNWAPRILSRGEASTQEDSLEPGDLMRPVLVMDPIYGHTRWSPGPAPATNRGGAWTVSDNAVDILLCGLTSAAHDDDGLELQNYVAAYGNWSCWPPGYGIGYRADRIDWDAALAVRARFPTYRLPAMVIGDGRDTPTFGEWVTANMLEPFGWFLVVIRGLLTLVAPRLLLEGEVPEAELGVDEILEFSDPDQAMDVVAGAVTYIVKGAGGTEVPLTVKATDFTGLFGGRAQYTVEDDAIELTMLGLHASQAGISEQVRRQAQRVLMRAVRAPWRVPLVIDGFYYALAQGSVVSITHPDMPNGNSRQRGWTNVLAQVIHAEPVRIDPKRGAVRNIVVIAYPGLRIGRVAPSGMITNVTGAGPWTCTLAANRYTAADADDYLGLPDTDAEAFTVTDAVKTISRAGVDVSTGYTVTNVGTNTVDVVGGAPPVAGDVLVFDDYALATDAQQTRFAAWSNDRGEVATGVPAFRFGES